MYWINPESNPGSGDVNGIFLQANNSSKVGYFASVWNDSGTLKIYVARVKGGIAENGFSYTTTLSTGTWYHFVVTYNGSTLQAFLNNSAIGDVASSGSGTSNLATTGFLLGREGDNTTARDWDGLIDEVGVWSKRFSSQEITDLYNSGSGQTMVQ